MLFRSMLPLGAKLNIGYFSRAFIVNSLLFYKSKIKQGNTCHNPEKDTTCNNESPIGVMEIKFFIRNGGFLYTSVPYPYQNFPKSLCCDKATHIVNGLTRNCVQGLSFFVNIIVVLIRKCVSCMKTVQKSNLFLVY